MAAYKKIIYLLIFYYSVIMQDSELSWCRTEPKFILAMVVGIWYMVYAIRVSTKHLLSHYLAGVQLDVVCSDFHFFCKASLKIGKIPLNHLNCPLRTQEPLSAE